MRIIHFLLLVILISGLAGCSFIVERPAQCEEQTVYDAGFIIEGPDVVFENNAVEFKASYDGPDLDEIRESEGEMRQPIHFEYDYEWSCDPQGAGEFDINGPWVKFIPNEVDADCEVTIKLVANVTLQPTYVVEYGLTILDSPNELDWELTWGRNLSISDMIIDDAGNIYLAGTVRTEADLDPGPGESIHSGNAITDRYGQEQTLGSVCVIKLSPEGNFTWARSFAASPHMLALMISFSPDGNLIITGHHYGPRDFGPSPEVVDGEHDYRFNRMFIAKLDTDGDFIWTHAIGEYDIGSAQCKKTLVDQDGKIYLIGNLGGTIDFDPSDGIALQRSHDASSTYYNMESALGFIAIYSADGDYVDCNMFGGAMISGYAPEVTSACMDYEGNVYIAGTYKYQIGFELPDGPSELHATGSSDIYLLKINTSGSIEWLHTWPTTGEEDMVFDMQIDTAGNLQVISLMSGTFDLDPGPGAVNITPPAVEEDDDSLYGYSGNESQIILCSYDQDGSLQSHFIWHGYYGSFINSGNLRMSATDTYTWLALCYGLGIDVDPGPGEHVVNALREDSYASAVVVQLDSNQQFVWAEALPSSHSLDGILCVTGPDGSLHVTGGLDNGISLRKYAISF